jgi:peptidoglycan/xylan/chitin deacetylase (PgdA/CDA1 family)
MAQTIPILMYHSVDTRSSHLYRRWVVTPEQFGRHLDVLAAQACRPITISALSAAMRKRQVLPPGTVAITFDDGLRDFLTGAMPLLQRHRFVATLFVVTGYVGSTSRWLRHLGEDGRSMLSWGELRDIADSGIECGAHTRTHPQLDIIRPSAAFDEIRGSKCDLEDRLGRCVSAFAYPHGYASRTTRALVGKAGLSSACRVGHALSSTGEDLFALSRIIVTEDLKEDRLIPLVGGAGLPIAPPHDRIVGVGWRLFRKIRQLKQALN